jgi:hypothetical protein
VRIQRYFGLVTVIIFFKCGPVDPSQKLKRASNSIQRWILAIFKLKFGWKKWSLLIVTNIV